MRACIAMLLVGCGATAHPATSEAIVIDNHVRWPMVVDREDVFVDGRLAGDTAALDGVHEVSVRALVTERCGLRSDAHRDAWILHVSRRVLLGSRTPWTVQVIAGALDDAPSIRFSGAASQPAAYVDDGQSLAPSGATCDAYQPPGEQPPNVPFLQWNPPRAGVHP